jgi:hypothetical protein
VAQPTIIPTIAQTAIPTIITMPNTHYTYYSHEWDYYRCNEVEKICRNMPAEYMVGSGVYIQQGKPPYRIILQEKN